MQNFLKINDKDNVVVALVPISQGEEILVEWDGRKKTVTAGQDILQAIKWLSAISRRAAR